MTFGEQKDVVAYWRCCDKVRYMKTFQGAREGLEYHERDCHHKKPVGSFGYNKRPLRVYEGNVINLDLSKLDEVCLLPDKWCGRYPRTEKSDKLRKISEVQNHRCCYCGKHTWSKHYGEDGRQQDMSTIEHIVPRRHGGTYKKTNIVMACSECNGQRAISNPVIFMYEKLGLLNWELVPID